MKVAVLGVGLVGGSIGLATRRRLEAEVAGFDPRPREPRARASSWARSTMAASSVAEACEGAEVIFCAAPVGALPALVAEALGRAAAMRSSPTSGSTKRELVDGARGGARRRALHRRAPARRSRDLRCRERPRRPLRGRSLVPDPDRGRRAASTTTASSARSPSSAPGPQAIDAAAHDRLMATVSHLPHVLADVLVSRAAEALAGEAERPPEVGPSFRDTTRVAGANPAIWRDILHRQPRCRGPARSTRSIGRLEAAARLLRDARRRRDRRLAPRRPRRPAPPARRRARRRPGDRAPRRGRQPAGHGRRDRARARPRRGQHRGHGALPGAGHVAAARSPCGSPAPSRPSAPPTVVRELRPHGHASRATRRDAIRAVGTAPRRAPAAAGQVDLPPRGAILAAMGEGETRIDDYLDSEDTRSTLRAVAALGADVSELGGSEGRPLPTDSRRRPARCCRRRRIDVGNAGTLLRILPGWLAGQGRGEWTARRRRVDPAPSGRSDRRSRCGRWARRSSVREGALPPLRVRGAQAPRHRAPAPRRERPGQVLPAPRGAARRRPDRDRSSPRRPATTPSGCSPPRVRRCTSDGNSGRGRAGGASSSRAESTVPGDFSSAAFWIAGRGADRPRTARSGFAGSASTRLGPACCRSSSAWARRVELTDEAESARAAASRSATIVARHGPLRGDRWSAATRSRARSTSYLWSACWPASRPGETQVARRRRAPPQGVGPDRSPRRRPARLGGDAEELDDGFVVRGTGGLRGGTLDAAGDHRLAMLGAIAGLASREGVEVRGMEAAAVSYPGFERDLAALYGH